MHFARPLVRVWLAAALAALLCLSGAATAQRNMVVAKAQPVNEARIALVIGNADYANAPLVNPVNDARAVAERLTALRFRVTRLENATQDQMYEAIRVFGDQLRGGGVGLFYYAGHALQVRGRNFLLPVRASIQREDEIVYRTVDTGQVLDKMESAGNRVNIVILDACRNNPFGREFRSVQPGLAVVDAPSNTLIAFATAPGAVASDGNGSNGLYTQHLLQALVEPGLALEDAFKQVRAGVRRDSAGRQVPWESTSLEVPFFFDPLPAQTAAVPAPPPDPLTLEMLFWASVNGSNDAADYRAYLQRYPGGQFAALAANRLRVLTAPAAAAPVAPAAASQPVLTAPRPTVTVAAPQATPAPATPMRPPPTAPALTAPPSPGPSATPLRALLGHTGEVLAMAFSRNGSQVLSAGADRGLRLWDTASGRELRRFGGEAGVFTAVALSPDGRGLIAGGGAQPLRLWDIASGAEVGRLVGHTGAVTAVAYGPTGRYTVSAAMDGELIVWDLPSRQVLQRARASTSAVRGIALSPDGRQLLAASDDGQVRLWDVGAANPLRSFGPLGGAAMAVGFGDQARRVSAVDARGEWWSWDATTGALLRRVPASGAGIVAATIAADGSAGLTVGHAGDLNCWDLARGLPLWRALAAGQPITALALDPRGGIALSAGADRGVRLWAARP